MADEKKKATVLIVDDTPTNLEVLQDMLASNGFELLIAVNGESAIQQAEYARPDIILLDVMMPGIDGFETCRRLKAEDATREIPVIFMTALSETRDKVRGFELGGVDYVTKPLQHEEVRARMTTHLTLRNLQRELQAMNEELERRVAERTAELSQANVRLARRVNELVGIDQLVQIQMDPSAEIRQVYEEILRIVAQVMEVQQVAIYRPDETTRQLEAVAGMGFSAPGRIDVAERLSKMAAMRVDDQNSPVAQAFAAKEPKIGEKEGAAPILYQEEVLGVLRVRDLSTPDEERETVVNTLLRLGREVALVFRVMQITEDMKSGESEVKALLEDREPESGDGSEINAWLESGGKFEIPNSHHREK